MRLKDLGRFYVLGMHAPRTVLFFSFLFAIVAGLAAQKLKIGDIFSGLLPQGTESVANLAIFKDHFGELGNLVIVVEGSDSALVRDYAGRFAKRIETLPAVYHVQFRQPIDYFQERKWLFVDLLDLEEMERRIDRALVLEKEGVSPIFSDLMDFADAENRPDLSFKDIESKYKKKIGIHPGEYTASDDGRTLVLSVKAREVLPETNDKQLFIDAIRKIESDVKQEGPYTGIVVGYTGAYQTGIEAVAYTKREIVQISAIVFPLLCFILLVYFRRLDAVLLLGLPISIAILYTGGITYLVFGHLNVLTSFASGILAGLGSDYGIYLLSRYYQERESGQDCKTAIHLTFQNTGIATFLSLLTSVIALAGLLFSNFSVLIEFGAVGAMGLVVNYLAMMLLIPSILVLGDRYREWMRGNRLLQRLYRANRFGESHVTSHVKRFPWIVTVKRPLAFVGVALALCAAAALTVPAASKVHFESGEVNALDIPSNRLYDRVSSMIGASLNPTVLIHETLEDERRTVETVNTLLDTTGSESLVFNRVLGLSSLIPSEQAEKKTVINRIQKKYARLDLPWKTGQAALVASFNRTVSAAPITIEALPPEVKPLFVSPHSKQPHMSLRLANQDKNAPSPYPLPRGEGGRGEGESAFSRQLLATYLFPAFPRTEEAAMQRYQDGVMDLREHHGLRFLPVDGSFIAADALREIEKKAANGIGLILLFFSLILFVVLRPWDRAALILAHLLGVMILLSGILWLLDIRLTILNLVAIPIILGTGIDCFLHFNGQYSEDCDLASALRKQVNPILISSLTSMVGFGGLLFSANAGLRSLGWVAVIGLTQMAVVSIFIFPRCLLLESLKKTSKAPILVLLATMLLSMPVSALTSSNVSIDDRSYRDIDQLIAYGLAPTAIYGQRPWSRNEIARLVAGARKKYEARCGSETAPKFCARAESILSDLETAFHDERVDRGDGPGEKKTYRLYLAEEIVWDYTGLSSPWRQVPVDNGLGPIAADTNPLVAYRGGRHIVYGHSLGFETHNRAKLSDYVAVALDPRTELLLPEGDDVEALALVQHGYAKFGIHNVELTLGRDSLLLGHGPYGGVLASSNARPLDMIKLGNDEPFQYPSVLRHLGYHKYSFFVAHLGPEYRLENAFMYGMAASWKPISLLELGFKHQITVGGEGAPDTEFIDLVSEFFFYRRSGARYGGTNIADHRLGLDFRLAIPPLRGTVLYAEGIFEDYGRESFFLQFTQQMGFQAGIYAPLVSSDGRHDLRFQYDHIPAAYGRHGTWTSGLSLNRLLRGTATSPQGQSFSLEWNYAVSPKQRLRNRLEYVNSGNDQFGVLPSSTGGPDEIIKVQDNPAEHRFLATSGLAWEFGKGLSLRPTIGYEQVYNFNFGDEDRHHVMGQIEFCVRRK